MVTGGLASIVVEAMFAHGVTTPLTRIGVPDRYLECGSVPFLQSKYGLTSEAIERQVVALTPRAKPTERS